MFNDDKYYDTYENLEQQAEQELKLLSDENLKLKEYYKNYSNYIDSVEQELRTCKNNKIIIPKEDDRFAKYEKMKKMIPEGAIRQKMSLEGFTQEEIDNFFPKNETNENKVISIPVVDEKYKKYLDMMSKKLPEGAIRQSMLKDGFSKEEIDDVVSKLFPSTTKTASIKIKKEILSPDEVFLENVLSKIKFKKEDRKKEPEKIVEKRKTDNKLQISPDITKNINSIMAKFRLNSYKFYTQDNSILLKDKNKLFDSKDYEKLKELIEADDLRNKTNNINKFNNILPQLITILSSEPNIADVYSLLPNDKQILPIIEKYIKNKVTENISLIKIYELIYKRILDYENKNNDIFKGEIPTIKDFLQIKDFKEEKTLKVIESILLNSSLKPQLNQEIEDFIIYFFDSKKMFLTIMNINSLIIDFNSTYALVLKNINEINTILNIINDVKKPLKILILGIISYFNRNKEN